MCGIAAIVAPGTRELRATIEAMTSTLVHRGPDDVGIDIPQSGGFAFGMRRLSIVDLETGGQPMWNEDRTVGTVFNGEIYNFRELRCELEKLGHEFRSHHSDTEVVVHGWEEWGHSLFVRLNGMFACIVWDSSKQQLILARDRAGEKPLFIGKTSDGYVVGSELKALLEHRGLSRELDPVAISQYLTFMYVVAPRSILRDVTKLPAAHFAVIDEHGIEMHEYWRPGGDRAPRSEPALLEELDALLDDSVRQRMVADVPVGLFLSGGVDSTTIGYYMRRHSNAVESFSIGFDEEPFDETRFAQIAADALETRHRVEVLSERRVRELVRRVPDILDEPMGDSSILPTYLLSLFARRRVKVALGGDGSDELFLGYGGYVPLKVAWQLDSVPRPLRALAGAAARRTPLVVAGRGMHGLQFLRGLDLTPEERLLRFLADYRPPRDHLLTPAFRVDGDGYAEALASATLPRNGRYDPATATVAGYLRAYLQEDILVKVDRASMAASLEVRSPFLDPHLIDFALRAPARSLMRGLSRKHLVRTLMRGRVPDVLLDRPKRGFAIPLARWLRGDLAPLVREYLAPDRVSEGGLFDPRAVDGLAAAHLDGSADYSRDLWLLLQFELWRDRWLSA
jgi:asparagine synthase (glutamine-hydrolysing)